MRILIVIMAALWLAACQAADEPATTHVASEQRGVVDSIFPMPVMIERFHAALPRRAHDLGVDAPQSRDELIDRLADAVARNDARALRALRLDIAEFGDLYFPHSQYASDRHRMPPGTLWLLLEQNGLKGEESLLRAYGGAPLHLTGYTCEREPVSEGPNRFWHDCRVRRQSPDGTVKEERLFSAILERAGRFKFVSFANDL